MGISSGGKSSDGINGSALIGGDDRGGKQGSLELPSSVVDGLRSEVVLNAPNRGMVLQSVEVGEVLIVRLVDIM